MSTIIRYSNAKNGSISLLIDTGFVNQIFKCLQRAGVTATPPKDAIFSKKRMYIDPSGRIQIEDEPVESEIVVAKPPADLEKILGACLREL